MVRATSYEKLDYRYRSMYRYRTVRSLLDYKYLIILVAPANIPILIYFLFLCGPDAITLPNISSCTYVSLDCSVS